ncbi:MAG: chromophore lyase [Prevotella sp.]|nr:chromophore lyase [Prevotella sp.]
MNKLACLILLLATTIVAQAIPSNSSTPVGWASVGASVTGGNDENPVVVTTLAELESALQTARNKTKNDADSKMTIYIKGEIETSGYVYVQDTKNLTIYGLPGSAMVNTNRTEKAKTGIMLIKRCQNLIMRNMTFKSAGAYDIDANDNLTLQSSEHIWIDHCDFQDGVDGNFDCNNQANYVSVTWCRFRYLIEPKAGGSGGSNDHRFSNLWGGSDTASDEGCLNTTFACCWWDEGCRERMPRIRFGKVHVLNCLYSTTLANYCVGVGYRSNVYIEKCAFTSSKAKATPWKNYATKTGYTDYNVTVTGNLGATDTQKRSGSIEYFIPSSQYKYDSLEASEVEAAVADPSTGAGATLNIQEGEPFTTQIIVGETMPSIVETIYYNTAGVRVSPNTKGVLIKTDVMSDQTRKTSRVIVR